MVVWLVVEMAAELAVDLAAVLGKCWVWTKERTWASIEGFEKGTVKESKTGKMMEWMLDG